MIQSASNHAPVAVIDKITPSPAKQGEAVMFHGHGTDEEGSIRQYKWLSSIDGVIGMESSFILSNLSRGTHTIYFQVKDNIEWSPQVTATLVIERNPADNPNNQPPLANIVSPNQGLVNESILFDGSQSYDAEGSITGYWTFGDNTSGTGLSQTHQYTAPGTYIVSLTVVDEDGESSSASISVNIVESYSQNSNSEGITLLDFEIPFPVLLLLVSLIVIGLFAGLILKIKHG
jgi:PKD repeat protein